VAHESVPKSQHFRLQMPRVAATRELLAPRQDVWEFIAEPNNLPNWWPGVHAVQPDRRGLAPGARWHLAAGRQTGGAASAFLRRPEAAGTIIVLEVRTGEFVRLLFVDDRIDAALLLQPAADGRTRATLEIEGPWLRVSRSLPRRALNRLYALCQTGAEF
jgi:uncharacterized protein YndB with AHSA1/START domain